MHLHFLEKLLTHSCAKLLVTFYVTVLNFLLLSYRVLVCGGRGVGPLLPWTPTVSLYYEGEMGVGPRIM